MRRHPTSRGLTLLEILLVLGLLVVIAAMVMPTVGGTLQNHRLRKAADLLRAEWAKARAKAMQTGRTYVFRYQLESNGYVVEPWYSDEDLLESDQVGLGGAASVGGVNTVPAPTFAMADTFQPAKTRHLPEDIIFAASEVVAEVRDVVTAEAPASFQAPANNLSDPIFFYPDGTTSTSRLLVMNQRPRYILMTMRGLTGVVYVSEPLTQEQVQ